MKQSAAGMLTLPPLDDGERVVARGASPALADLTEPSLFGRSSSGSWSTRIGLRSKCGAARCWPETFRQTPRTIQTAVMLIPASIIVRLRAGTGTRPEAARRENHAGSCPGSQG